MVEHHSPVRHPIAFIRDKLGSHARAETDTVDEDDLSDPSDDRPDQEHAALAELLNEDPNVRAVGFSATASNVVEVYLDPWSEASAEWIRGVCAPRSVRLVAGLPPDWPLLDDDER